jgi:hypothetical protein
MRFPLLNKEAGSKGKKTRPTKCREWTVSTIPKVKYLILSEVRPMYKLEREDRDLLIRQTPLETPLDIGTIYQAIRNSKH